MRIVSGLVLLVCLFGTGARVDAASNSSIEGKASAVIVEQLGIESVADMDFGTIIKPTYGGNVVLNASNYVTCPDNYNWTCTGTPVSGKFMVYGANGTVNVTYTSGVLSDGNGNTMNLTISGSSTLSITNGRGSLSVGATLRIGDTTPAGSYSTSNNGGTPYTVTVNY